VLTLAVGFEVPHYHLHLIPAWSMADMNFSKAQRHPADEMVEMQTKIKARMSH
jgi:histidine triad (HIT) family protein